MKTLKSKLLILPFITLALTGCMPDSLTKFKKEPPKKEEDKTPVVEVPPPAESYVVPSRLSYTNKQIITVASNENFLEGETIIQPITPPLTEAVVGRVIKIIGFKHMAIETFNGTFSENASLDNNSSAYQVEKTFIIPHSSCTDSSYTTKTSCEADNINKWSPAADVHYNLALSLDSKDKYAIGDIVTSSSGSGQGATGRVMFVETIGLKDTIYIQYLTGTATGTSTAPTFYEGDDLDKGAKVEQVLNQALKVNLASVATFVKGSDIVSDKEAAAYTNALSVGSKMLTLTEISKTASGTFFKVGDLLYNHETLSESSASSAITAITHDNYFIFERGKTMALNPANATGGGLNYSITPSLPAGLKLDAETGVISGAATSVAVKKDYKITATNNAGSTTFVAAIEVKDFFEVIEKTGASSAIIHKVGDYQVNRKCRIDATDIASLSNGKALDIRCFLDMEEEDIFETDIKLNLFTGPGICKYIRYEPYYFYSWQPHQSTGTSTKYPQPSVIRTGCDALADSGEIPTEDLCEGNYKYDDESYPNCDEGKLTYYTESYSQADPQTSTGACTLNSVTVGKVDCGGKRSNCISGAVKDVMNSAELELGFRNKISSTSTGIDTTYTHASPISKGDNHVNLRTANGTINNQCYSSAAETLTWKDATAAESNLKASPFSADSNPFYTVTCLDAAYDVKARIRVIVRDWNKTFRISDGIYKQDYIAPATNMNITTPDPIFNTPYNNKSDWDDDYAGVGTASTFTPNTCADQAPSNCTIVNGPFMTNSDCTSAGGTVVVPGSCSGGGFTDYRSCVSAGVCSNVAMTDAGTCAHGGETWTPRTWTQPTCRFTNQNQCEYYGGVWAGQQQYKFPESLLKDSAN